MKPLAKPALRIVTCAAILLAPYATFGQDRIPTRILVPTVPGGSTDVTARLIAQELTRIQGTRVIVENRPGAAGVIASQVLTAASPDGRTLMLQSSAHAINELMYEKLPYSTLDDFTPIMQLTDIANVLITTKTSIYKTVTDIITASKMNSGALLYGATGAGTSAHLAGALFSHLTGIKMEPVQFKGGGESIVALVGGHISLSFNTVPTAHPQILAGRVHAIAVTTTGRAPLLKDVPTIGESGVPGYIVSNWAGVLGPARMNANLVARINADIREVLNDPGVVQRFEYLGIMVKASTTGEFNSLIRADIAKWRPIVKQLGLRGNY